MMAPKPQILYISSASPVKGPGSIGWQHVTKLKESGYDVDMLTLNKETSLSDVLYVRERGFWTKAKEWLKYKLGMDLPGPPYFFFYKKETEPPVPIKKILKLIDKSYDLVFVYFWQEMLSFQTIEAIYDKLNRPVVFFLCPDFSHMSGGCHFTNGCLRYQTGCGSCPAFRSKDENDFTHWNVIYRKKFYEKVKPVVFGNNYMNSIYQKSFLLKDVRKYIYQPLFNIDSFKPLKKQDSLRSFGINDDNLFVISFGCQNLSDPRKGISYLLDSLDIFSKRLTDKEIEKILLLVAGSDYESIKESLPFRSISTGFLSLDRLSAFYSAADFFVCPSVDDPGPSMVIQSIACGTPVVGFKMGYMLDVVLGEGTGYCAELKDSNDLANGIEKFYRMDKTEYDAISKHCRQYAVENAGLEKRIEVWMELYEKYRER